MSISDQELRAIHALVKYAQRAKRRIEEQCKLKPSDYDKDLIGRLEEALEDIELTGLSP